MRIHVCVTKPFTSYEDLYFTTPIHPISWCTSSICELATPVLLQLHLSLFVPVLLFVFLFHPLIVSALCPWSVHCKRPYLVILYSQSPPFAIENPPYEQ
jgi:hypothetical protein